MRNYVFGSYFCGNKISEYGLKNGYVDYATLAKSFDAVLANDIMEKTADIGYWDIESGDDRYYEVDGETMTVDEYESKLDEMKEQLDALDDTESDEYKELESTIDEWEQADEMYHDFYQFYIISSNGASILEDYTNETVWYNSELDLYVWGVTHYGTSWDYVLTDIKCNAKEEDC